MAGDICGAAPTPDGDVPLLWAVDTRDTSLTFAHADSNLSCPPTCRDGMALDDCGASCYSTYRTEAAALRDLALFQARIPCPPRAFGTNPAVVTTHHRLRSPKGLCCIVSRPAGWLTRPSLDPSIRHHAPSWPLRATWMRPGVVCRMVVAGDSGLQRIATLCGVSLCVGLHPSSRQI